MLDVEFLLQPLQHLERPIIYLHRSGALRRNMHAHLAAHFDRLGTAYSQISQQELAPTLGGGNLFADTAAFGCDLGHRSADEVKLEPVDLLVMLETGIDRLGSLFVGDRNPILKLPGWKALTERCLLVSEPALTRSTLRPALRYLAATSDLGVDAGLVCEPGFVRSFEALLEDRAGLPDLMRRFDDTVLSCTDPGTGRYIGASYLDPGEQVIGSLTDSLRMLLDGSSDITILVGIFAARRGSGLQPLSLIRSLFRSVRGMLRRIEVRTAGTRRADDPVKLCVLGATVLAWEGEMTARAVDLRLPDTFLLCLDMFARDLVKRMRSDRPLDGLWPPLACAVADHASGARPRLMESRTTLIEALSVACDRLAEVVDASWLPNLRVMLSAALQPPVAAEPETLVPADSLVLRSFDDVIGQSAAVRALKRRIMEGAHGLPLILHGPAGVGKDTLVQLYAKTLFCESPAGGSPCCQCDQCIAFDNGNIVGLSRRIDAKEETAANTLKQALRDVAAPRTSRFFVIRITNADRCRPDVFDTLLKTLEEPPPDTVFVMTADNLRGVRTAGQSRSQPIPLHPLTDAAARKFVQARCSDLSATLDDPVVSLILAIGRGLPTLLETACHTAARLTDGASPHALLKALDLDWAEHIASVFEGVLNDAYAEGMAWPTSVAGPVSITRLWSVLSLLPLAAPAERETAAVVEPALLGASEQVLADCLACVVSYGQRLGSDLDVWSTVASAALGSVPPAVG